MGVTGAEQEKVDRFRRSLGLPFPLVGDADGSIRRTYGVRWPIVGIAKRVTYVIGRDRRIQSAFRNERDMAAHAAQACEFVARLSD